MCLDSKATSVKTVVDVLGRGGACIYLVEAILDDSGTVDEIHPGKE